MNALNNLTFMISLIDKVSGPMGKVMKSIDMASTGFKDGAQKIGYGTAGLVGAAYSINRLLEPTKEMHLALGEVKSLGVADDTLIKLRDTALKFSAQYGASAADVVRSSYDIQSAIAGLSGDELARFTEVSGVLAKGTKANVADVTNYVGTMYGIFQKNADAMGRAQWIEQMAAQTAKAVNIFKTDGKGMADAFKAIGAAAQNFGISSAEQFAVLGKLQATMSGSEAGTKYRSFLDNIGKAQETLNLQFTDAQGRMLPIVDILGKINQKFGDIDKVAEAGLLKKAFGTDEAVALIKLLNNDIGGLKNNIAEIGQQTGMTELNKMADAMTDPWAKMKTGVDAISTSIGTKLLPILLPTIAAVNETTQSVFSWTDANPELSKAIGILTLSTFGFIGTLALFSIAAGYATIVSTGWGLAMTNIFTPLKTLTLSIWGALPAIKAFVISMFTTPITLAGLKAGLISAAQAVWGFTTALFANPLTWWVLGIAAVVGVVVAAIVYWKEWTAVVSQFGTIASQLWNSILIGLDATKNLLIDITSRFLETIGAFALIDMALAAWDTLKGWWSGFKAWLGTLNPFALVGDGLGLVIAGFEAFPLWWSSFKAWIDTLNPFALVGDGIGLVMAGFEAIPQWWSNFTAWIGTLNPFAILTAGIGLLVAGFEAIPQWWTNFTAWIASLNPFTALSSAVGWLVGQFDAIKQWWSGFKGWLASLNPFAAIGNGIGRVLNSISSIPGPNLPSVVAAAAPPAIAPPPSLDKGPADDRYRPGILKQIVNAQGNSKSVDVGGITVNNYGNKPVSGQLLADQLAMAAG